MLSTLSSFLPSALQQSSDDKRQQQQQSSDSIKRLSNPVSKPGPAPAPQESAPEAKAQPEETAGKRKRNTQETFIVVRPPPAKSNHPLNLQVQLVPPQARDRSFRRSVDYSTSSHDGADDNALTRTNSNRSDTSMYSAYSSVSSFSSVASSSSSRRMIIPLYNLQAHNVMTNTIVDAGTDAKVAKLSKRGLELLGLAVLEPIELFGAHSSLTMHVLLPPSSARTSLESRGEHAPTLSPSDTRSPDADRPHTPTSFISSSSHGPDATPTLARVPFPAPTIAEPAPTGAKKIFGRLFKKRDATNQPIPGPSDAGSQSFLRVPKGRSAGNPKRASFASPPAKMAPTSSEPLGQGPPAPIIHLQPTVLGIQPVLSSPVVPPRGRPHSYAWVVRRWIKGAEDGLLNNVMGFMGTMGLSDDRRNSRIPDDGQQQQVEVQFIWSRRKSKSGASTERRRRQSLGVEHPSVSSLGSAGRRSKRNSLISTATVSTAAGDGDSSERDAERPDDGEESDPEDSETPWTCTLVVRRVRAGEAVEGSDSIRLRIATFSPTPHHPKVVALLKVPFPLPDIVVDQMIVHRRIVSPQGLARPGYDPDKQMGLMLTAEEIKDVVCSTGLWLVVRENVGGVGKVSRKGDGWRIRA